MTDPVVWLESSSSAEEEAVSVNPEALLPGPILVVEDVRALAGLAKTRLTDALGVEVVVAHTYAEARARLIDPEAPRLFAAVADLNLPDATDGQVVDLILSQNVPCIVLTASYSDTLREQMLAKRVLDYLIKNDVHAYDACAELLLRIARNRDTHVLVVDDDAQQRRAVVELLEHRQLQVHQTDTGEGALEALAAHEDLRLVIVNDGGTDGQGLRTVNRLRRERPKGDLAIVGLWGDASGRLPAQVLKSGADDFLRTPVIEEEFHCRVTQNIEMVERLQQLREASNRDFLTKMYNRKYLYEAGQVLFYNARRQNLRLAVAMFDLDNFKKLNDTLGHAAGDAALVHVAKLLNQGLRRSDLVARMGGEEFCALLVNVDEKTAYLVADRLRRSLETTPFAFNGRPWPLTMSVGLTLELGSELEYMVARADDALYDAKKGGRNRVLLAHARDSEPSKAS